MLSKCAINSWCAKKTCSRKLIFCKNKAVPAWGLPSVDRLNHVQTKSQDTFITGKNSLAYNTEYSQAVTHQSTNSAQYCLTSVIRRVLVHSIWCGCRHSLIIHKSINKILVEKCIYTVGYCPWIRQDMGRIHQPTCFYFSIVWVGKWANPSGTAMLGEPVIKPEQAPKLHPLLKISLISKGGHAPRIRY